MTTSGNVTSDDISAAQSRAGRALLGWTQEQLAAASGVPKRTIARLELNSSPQRRTLIAVRTCLEGAGVIFVAENGEGAGVRLRKASSSA